MKEMLVSLLKPFAEVCYKFVTAISPQTALIIYILVIVALTLWVLTLKQESLCRFGAAGKSSVVHDLRLWAVLILLVQILIYIIFK